MSHIAEEYAKSLGVKIGKPYISDHFYPIPHRKYITIHNDNKVPAKEYSYWGDAIKLLKPHLGDIKIVQVGALGEKTIDGVDDHLPTNSLKQLFYIIKNSMGHIGIDSVPVHIASSYDKPIVALYAHTFPSTCQPLWNKKSKTKLLESHRNGLLPSFSLSENPQTINLIKPDDIARATLEVLRISGTISEETCYIGDRYGTQLLDVIPNERPAKMFGNVNVRMDLCHNEEILAYCVANHKCEITTSKPFNVNILKYPLVGVNYIANEFDEDFAHALKRSGKRIGFLCTSDQSLSRNRAKLFDYPINRHIVSEDIQEKKDRIKLPQTFNFHSSKTVISGEKIAGSLYDLFGRKDPNLFWKDIEWMRVFEPK